MLHSRPAAESSRIDVSNLVMHFQDRIYRLALFVVGDAGRAATLTVKAFANLSIDSSDPERDLVVSMLRQIRTTRRARQAWKFHCPPLERVDVVPETITRLLRVLASATPLARLALGASVLLGWEAETLTVLAGDEALRSKRQSDDALIPLDVVQSDLRCDLTITLGYVPATASRSQMQRIMQLRYGMAPEDEVRQLRGLLLTSAEMRALRDGLQRSESWLQRVLPVLFAATPPAHMTRRLIDQAAAKMHNQQRPARRKQLSVSVVLDQTRTLLFDLRRRPRTLLFVGVLSLVLALLLIPSVPGETLSSDAPRQTLSAADLTEAALYRFEQPAVEQGVLHEAYVARIQQDSWTFERWYDYASPHRLRVHIQQSGDERPIYALATDGQERIQYRWRDDAVDVAAEESEIDRLMPILRQQPDPTFFEYDWWYFDVGRYYLIQAYRAAPISLGAARVGDRSAQIITYRTEWPFPPLPGDDPTPTTAPAQVMLTIDQETYAVLDVTVLIESEGETLAAHPWQATRLSVLPTTTADNFVLNSMSAAQSALGVRTGLANPRYPFLQEDDVISLSEALQSTDQPLYAIAHRPEQAMRGFVLRINENQAVIVYEGVFHTIILIPPEMGVGGPFDELQDESVWKQTERFAYQVFNPAGETHFTIDGFSYIEVSMQGETEPFVAFLMLDQLFGSATYEATVHEMVDSLQVLTEQNVESLARYFYDPDRDGTAAQWHTFGVGRSPQP